MSTSTSSVERVQGDTDVHVPQRFNGTTASKDYYVNVGQRASGSRTWRLVEVIARDGTSTSKARKGEERGMREQISVARTSQPCLLNGETDGK